MPRIGPHHVQPAARAMPGATRMLNGNSRISCKSGMAH
jgi:hypothetical protein